MQSEVAGKIQRERPIASGWKDVIEVDMKVKRLNGEDAADRGKW